MAENEVKVGIRLDDAQFKRGIDAITRKTNGFSDDAERAFKKSGTAFNVFVGNLASNAATKGFDLLGKGIGKTVDLFKEGIQAAQKQEIALNKLSTQLKISGSFSQEAFKNMQDFASELQKVSTVGDETTLEMLAFAKAMGASNDQATKIVSAAADMSASLGIDMQSAVRNVSKTLGGYAGELGEVIPKLKNLTKEQLQAGDGVALLAKKFKGAALGEVNTFGGAVDQAANSWGDFLEKVGDVVIKNPLVISTIKKLSVKLNSMTKFMSDNQVEFRKFFNDILTIGIPIIQNLIKVMNILRKTVGFVVDNFALIPRTLFKFGKGVAIGFTKGGDAVRAYKKELDRAAEASEGFSKGLDKAFENTDKALEGLRKKLLNDTEKDPINIKVEAEVEKAKVSKKAIKQIADSFNDPIFDKALSEVKDELINDAKNNKASVGIGIGKAFGGASNVLGGRPGAENAVRGGIEVAAGLLGVPQIAGPAADLALQLAKGAEHSRAMVKDFAKALPDMVEGIMESVGELPTILAEELLPRIPDIIQKFIEGMPQAASGLALAMPTVAISLAAQAPTIAKSLIEGLVEGAPRFIQEMINKFKDMFDPTEGDFLGGIFDSGTDSKSLIKRGALAAGTGGLSEVIPAIGRLFADGGIVPTQAGVPNTGDNVVVGVNPGEMILNKQMQGNLLKFLRSPSSGGGISINVQGNIVANNDAEIDKLVRRIGDAIELRNVNLRGV